MQYAVAVGFRGQHLGVFGGLRANASSLKLGGDRGSYASMPLFGRLELAAGSGSLSFEAWARPLVGREQWGGALYAAFASRPTSTRPGLFSPPRSGFIGISLAHTDTGFCGGELFEDCTSIDHLGLTTISLLVGRGL